MDMAPKLLPVSGQRVELNEVALVAFKAKSGARGHPDLLPGADAAHRGEGGTELPLRGAWETGASSLRQNILRPWEEVAATGRQNCKIKDPGAARAFGRSRGVLSGFYILLWEAGESSGDNTRFGFALKLCHIVGSWRTSLHSFPSLKMERK